VDEKGGKDGPLSYLEALSATGLRALRVAKETKGLSTVVANDLEARAVEQIRRNVGLNGLVEGRDVTVSHADALDLMHAHRGESKRFDIVDIDPYGPPTIFLDGAVQCVKDGGLLQVTATDLMNLCGGSADVCFRKYGAVPIKSRFCHEMAIRIVLANIALRAQAHGRSVEPVMSFMIDFYVRVFVRVGSSGAQQQLNVTQIGHVWQCPNCHYFETQAMAAKQAKGNKYVVSSGTPVPPNCPFCASHFKMAGPLWLGPLHQPAVIEKVAAHVESRGETFASSKKLLGLLSVAATELNDVPLFYNLSDLGNVLRSTLPAMPAFRSALVRLGFRVSGCHVEPYAFKTDAPMDVVWDVLKVFDVPVICTFSHFLLAVLEEAVGKGQEAERGQSGL
jgi:tRNA (guanine26-N2/guanine27-N2)-dimethyltransferase